MPNIIIILIIASDNLNEYIEMQQIWKKYMNIHPNIKSFFMKNNQSIGCDILLDEESNTIYVNGFENYIPGIFDKTIESIKYCLKNFDFDYIYRTNLSSFLSLDKMYNFICNKHIHYGGVIGNHDNIHFASGCGFFMSKEVCEFLVNYDMCNINRYQYLDDVIISLIITQKYNITHIDRIDINSLDSPYFENTEIEIFHYRCNTGDFRVLTVEIMKKLYQRIIESVPKMDTLFNSIIDNSVNFISGEKIQGLCDVSIYSKEHLEQYQNLIKYCNKLIYVGSNIDEYNKQIIETSYSFFIKPDWLNYFSDVVMPHINHPFILVTHNSDHTVGPVNNNYNHIHTTSHYDILNNSYLINWYGVNMLPNKKGINLPIGLENSCWNGYDYNVCLNNRNNEKEFLLYFNFNNTHPLRKEIRTQLITNGFIENKKCEWNEYIKDLSKHKFCISPPGNGIDCHRHWECIYVGCIPIVLTNDNDPIYHYFKNLPILFIDNYSIVTPQFLETQFELFKNRTFELELMTLQYWKNKFILPTI